MPGRRLTTFSRGPATANVSNDRPDRGEKALGVRAGVAGRADVHDFGPGARGRLANFPQVIGHVLADRFRQAGRGDADHLGAVLADDVFQALPQVLAAPEDRRRLGKIRAGDVDRLLEMADHVAADVRRAALRAVQKGDGPFNAAEGQAGPQRGADLAGVAGSRFRHGRLQVRNILANRGNHGGVLTGSRRIKGEPRITRLTRIGKAVPGFNLMVFIRVIRVIRGFSPTFSLPFVFSAPISTPAI